MVLFKRRSKETIHQTPDSQGRARSPKEKSPKGKKSPTQKVADEEEQLHTNNDRLGMLSTLIETLSSAKDASTERSSLALRKIFTMSEGTPSQPDCRTQMVKVCDGKLIPALLHFLTFCEKGSNEQYLTLLILNNLSIPAENKKAIGIDHCGTVILAKLLCQDPSCHLIGIILVNLSFSDSDLRRRLVDSRLELLPALAYAIKVAILPAENGKVFMGRLLTRLEKIKGELTPSSYLSAFLTEENGRNESTVGRIGGANQFFVPSEITLPETCRWCLCAIKNLTYPSTDPTIAAETILNTGILPILLFCVSVNGHNHDPTKDKRQVAAPFNWEANSAQDAALSALLNLCYTISVRSALKETEVISSLVRIAEYSTRPCEDLDVTEEKQLASQCLKARMALSYLVGSEGLCSDYTSHLGSNKRGKDQNSNLVVLGAEAPMLLELLAHALHNRGKKGPGGFSPATFHLKPVLFAIRCLLTNAVNRKTFYAACGTKLNALLLKVVAYHSFLDKSMVDEEAAEYAVTSLYLLSNYGFNEPFLPNFYNKDLVSKVLLSYSMNESVRLPAKHAAEQLLLRMNFLDFESTLEEELEQGVDTVSDYQFNKELLESANEIVEMELEVGAEPMQEIFNRPVVRQVLNLSKVGLKSRVDVFRSALEAVQDICLDSNKVGPIDEVDDVLIANNIVANANGGKATNYGYIWSWEDHDQKIYSEKSGIRKVIKNFQGKRVFKDDEPFSFLDFTCACDIPNAPRL